jgi:hypothetical protein
VYPRAGPQELKLATWSSERELVPKVFAAPTVIADGSMPGE